MEHNINILGIIYGILIVFTIFVVGNLYAEYLNEKDSSESMKRIMEIQQQEIKDIKTLLDSKIKEFKTDNKKDNDYNIKLIKQINQLQKTIKELEKNNDRLSNKIKDLEKKDLKIYQKLITLLDHGMY